MAKSQVPGALKEETKMKLSQKSPDEVAVIVAGAIDGVNNGSVVPLDTLIKKRLEPASERFSADLIIMMRMGRI